MANEGEEPGNSENPGYYAVIPATVRYDKSLPQGAKLLYGEISALCNKKGFCWARNEYFAELYEATERTIIGWIQRLKEAGHITVSFKYFPDSKKIKERYIHLAKKKGEKQVEEGTGNNLVVKKFSPPDNLVVKMEAQLDGSMARNFPFPDDLVVKPATPPEDLVVKKFSPLEELVVKKSSPPSGEKIFLDNITSFNTTKAAAADQRQSKIEKPPEKAAAVDFEEQTNEDAHPGEPSKQDTANLKSYLESLNPGLRFDEDFYPKILAFLAEHQLGFDYLSWFYAQCKKKAPRSLRDYFFKVFLLRRYVEIYQDEVKPPPEPTITLVTCPACSAQHNVADDSCPQCGLSKEHWQDSEKVFFRKRLYEMPPETQARYDAEVDFIISSKELEFTEKSKRMADLKRQYGLVQDGSSVA